MSGVFPGWYDTVTTINTSQTVVSSTDSKVALGTRAGRQYLRLTNLGPKAEFLAFKSTNAVKGQNFRLGTGENWESSPAFGNLIADSVSVISSESSTIQRLLKMECY